MLEEEPKLEDITDLPEEELKQIALGNNVFLMDDEQMEEEMGADNGEATGGSKNTIFY